jgi:hypothetical protein
VNRSKKWKQPKKKSMPDFKIGQKEAGISGLKIKNKLGEHSPAPPPPPL